MQNSFFLKDSYETDIALEVNEDVLEKIYEDNISIDDQLNICFAFITDTREKANSFLYFLQNTFENYSDLKVDNYDDLFEITGCTNKIKMSLVAINSWNQEMWDLGYRYDCKFDGWFVEGN